MKQIGRNGSASSAGYIHAQKLADADEWDYNPYAEVSPNKEVSKNARQ